MNECNNQDAAASDDETINSSTNSGGSGKQSRGSQTEDSNTHAVRWDQMFSRLLEFKRKSGRFS